MGAANREEEARGDGASEERVTGDAAVAEDGKRNLHGHVRVCEAAEERLVRLDCSCRVQANLVV